MKSKNLKHQRGAALVVGMSLLLVLTIIGVTAMKSAMMQEKMAATLKNRELADSAAMTMLTAAERFLFNYYATSNNVAIDTDSPPFVDPRSPKSYDFRNNRDMNDGYSEIDGVSINAKFDNQLHDEPRFIIEALESVAGYGDTAEFDQTGGSSNDVETQLFRIVAKANDPKGTTYSLFESVISVRTK